MNGFMMYVTDEDRAALAWVRDHGGLDHVRAEWRSRVPYDRYVRRRQSLLGHIAECETALGRRREIISRLGHRVSDLTNENAELRRRAMPEGMEWLLEVWPKWSNGEYCRFGDWWTADRYGDYEPRQLRRLVIYTPELLDEWEQGDGESYGYEWDFMRPSELGYRPDKAVAPEPAVLAADGEPLEVGQTVWHASNGIEFTVVGLPKSGEYQTVKLRLNDGAFTGLDPDQLTHQRPVLDADGIPIKVGDTVWSVNDGTEYEVGGIRDTLDADGDVCKIIECSNDELHIYYACLPPDKLTHTKPEIDSWERVEEDARGLDSGVDRELFTHTHEDIVRRCRALAERERGE